MNPLLISMILLAIIQGVTEFLPVSSSGHLVLANSLPFLSDHLITLNRETILIFFVMLHVASLIAILIFYSKDIVSLVKGFITSVLKMNFASDEVRTVRNIFVASVPAAIIGIFFHEHIESVFAHPLPVCFLLILNGIILITTKKITINDRSLSEATVFDSFLAGCCQAFAIMPGISRSGSTIAGSLFIGLKPSEAVKFSFFMAIPVIAGAGLLESGKLIHGEVDGGVLSFFAIAMAVCVVVAFLCLRMLVAITKKIRLDVFGYYTIAAGLAGVTFFLLV